MPAEREHDGENEGRPVRESEEASRPSTSLDQWEAQSVDVHKTAIPVYEEDDDRGLSKTFRISIVTGSILIMIAVILCLAVILPRSGKRHDKKLLAEEYYNIQDIAMACRATRYSDVCEASLRNDPSAVGAVRVQDLVKAAIGVAMREELGSHKSAQDLLRMSGGNVNLTAAAGDCEYLLGRAGVLLGRSQAFGLGVVVVEDVQAWMSAGLTYENDCRSALSYVNTTNIVSELIAEMDYVITLTSNALSMVDALRTYGNDITKWQPPTRRTVWGWSGKGEMDGLLDRSSSVENSVASAGAVTVAQDGSGQYTSVQAAVDAAPEGALERFTIYIRQGRYEETVRIPATKTYLALVGDGMGQSIITGRRNAQMPGITTYDSATVAVDGDHFVAVAMTFENTAGPSMHQAVALRVDSDKSVFYNCSFLGFQDTLYVHSLRQFYRNCRIEGTIDFVFGNAAAVFQNCDIGIRPGNAGVSTSVVAAQGRTDPAETTGLVFQNCSIDGTLAFEQGFRQSPASHRVYLGRPWKLFSRTLFLECRLSEIIRPEGWLPWNGSFALDTLFYGEYLDVGDGAGRAHRVPWSDQISYTDALFFTVAPFIQGDRWLPATNVPFTLAL